MLNRNNWWIDQMPIWLSILLSVVIFLQAFAASSCRQTVEESYNRAANPEDYQNRLAGCSDVNGIVVLLNNVGNLTSDAITAISTAVISIFTIVLAYVSHRQAKLTRESINLANREFVATNRPKLKVRRLRLNPLTDG